MCKDDPPKSERTKLINCYNRGGLTYLEEELKPRFAGVNINQPGITTVDGDFAKWIYVGRQWWCRKRTKRGGKSCPPFYEFARFVAVVDKSEPEEIDGLWDSRKHVTELPPIIVYSDGEKGYIVGYNEFEVLVEWEDPSSMARSPADPVKSMDGLTFEFIEDFEKFKKIFAKLKTS